MSTPRLTASRMGRLAALELSLGFPKKRKLHSFFSKTGARLRAPVALSPGGSRGTFPLGPG